MNIVTAQVSFYPLKQDNLSSSIDAALEVFARHGIEAQTGSMSTLLRGGDEKVFSSLLDAFRKVASLGAAVMVVTVSNACPWPGAAGSR